MAKDSRGDQYDDENEDENTEREQEAIESVLEEPRVLDDLDLEYFNYELIKVNQVNFIFNFVFFRKKYFGQFVGKKIQISILS